MRVLPNQTTINAQVPISCLRIEKGYVRRQCLNSSLFDGSRLSLPSGLVLALVFVCPRRFDPLTKNLRNGRLGEFGKCRNHAVRGGIFKAQ